MIWRYLRYPMVFLNMLPSQHLSVLFPSLPSHKLSICQCFPPALPREFQLTGCWKSFSFASWREGEKSPQRCTRQRGGTPCFELLGHLPCRKWKEECYNVIWKSSGTLGLCPAVKALTYLGWGVFSAKDKFIFQRRFTHLISFYYSIKTVPEASLLRFFLHFHQLHLTSPRISSLLRVNSMYEGCPLSQWEEGKQLALVSTRGVREAEGSSCFSCGFSFFSPCLIQWVCDFLWVQPNAGLEWQTLQRTARSWNVFAIVSLNPEQNQWGSCNLLALELPNSSILFFSKVEGLHWLCWLCWLRSPVWFAVAFWESCHVTAHMVPARLHRQCSSSSPRPQCGYSVSAHSCLFHLPFDQCHHYGHGSHCGWSQSSLLSPLKGFQSPPG